MLLKLLRHLQQEVKNALRTPTLKQKEAYGRLAHTLCAACMIGFVTVIFTESLLTANHLARLCGLLLMGIVLFASGALLSKGE